MAAPVCGLRAVRALRWAVLNVPKPTKVIESPRLSDLVMPSMSESTAAEAPALDEPVSFAIFAISSCLFMKSPLECEPVSEGTGYTPLIRGSQYEIVRIVRIVRVVRIVLRRLLQWRRQTFDRLLERGVAGRRISAEVDVRFRHVHVRSETLLVNRGIRRREIPH